MKPSEFGNWLTEYALPTWYRYGVDHKQGGFFELLRGDLTPVEKPRRARLTARQIYCFSAGTKFGWSGPGRHVVEQGCDYLQRYYIRPDNTIRQSISSDGVPVIEDRNLYDDAFVLFALAARVSTFGHTETVENLARAITSRTLSLCTRENGGLAELNGPLLSDPMMHFAEAALAWVEISSESDGFWHSIARAIFKCVEQQARIDAHNLIPEVFSCDQVSEEKEGDKIYKPGHQFEWGWLFLRWSLLENSPNVASFALRMIEAAEIYGIDYKFGVVVNSLNSDLKKHDCNASLWSQTERAKAWHMILRHPDLPTKQKYRAKNARKAALDMIARFIFGAKLGLWHDVMLSSGKFAIEPVRASSLYHLTCSAITICDSKKDAGVPNDQT